MKILLGFLPIVIIMCIILGPLLIFSSFNPINIPNGIKSFNAKLQLEIDGLGAFDIYRIDNILNIQ